MKPCDSVQNNSNTEMSNDKLVTASHTGWLFSGIGMRWFIPAKKLTTFRCSIITPLGRPVEPDV